MKTGIERMEHQAEQIIAADKHPSDKDRGNFIRRECGMPKHELSTFTITEHRSAAFDENYDKLDWTIECGLCYQEKTCSWDTFLKLQVCGGCANIERARRDG